MARAVSYAVAALVGVGSALMAVSLTAGQSSPKAKPPQLLQVPRTSPIYLFPQARTVAVLPHGLAAKGNCVCKKSSASLLRLPARTMQEPPGVKIATTSYDWQTNFLIKNRTVWSASDNVLQLVWMAGSGNPADAWPDRGTYYAGIDLTNPQNPEVVPTSRGWQRIEPVRTGWAAATNLSNGALGFVSHTPLRFGRNQGVLDEAWSVTQFGPSGSLWPYITTSSSGTLHVVYTYQSGANAGQVGYLRSTDEGQSWSEETFLSGGDAPQGYPGADHYIIEAGGGKVVAAYYALLPIPSVVLRVSTDDGATWGQPLIISGREPSAFYIDSTGVDTLGNQVQYFHTDTIPSVDVYSMLVDAQGKWHLLATVAAYYVTGRIVGQDTTYDVVNVVGAAPMGVYLEEGGDIVEVPLPEPALDAEGNLVQVVHTVASGYVDRLKLGMDDNGQLYAVLSAPKAGDIFSPPEGGSAGYGHIYVMAQSASGSWSAPVNITPDGIDCSFPTASKGGSAGYALIVYQAGTVPGSFVQGATWEAGKDDEIYCVAYALPTSVAEQRQGVVQLRVAPNPVTGASFLQVRSAEAGWATLELYTPLGQRLRTLYSGWLGAQESRSLRLDATELPAGVYYAKLSLNGSSVVEKVVVVR